jgi:hypothetical protein
MYIMIKYRITNNKFCMVITDGRDFMHILKHPLRLLKKFILLFILLTLSLILVKLQLFPYLATTDASIVFKDVISVVFLFTLFYMTIRHDKTFKK